jgi:hypothetical protein
MAAYGIQLGRVFFVGLLSVILTAAIIMGLQAMFYWETARVERSEDFYPPPIKLERLLVAQRARLTDYRVEDAEKGIIAIPVRKAMDLVVAELSGTGNAQAPSGGDVSKEKWDER